MASFLSVGSPKPSIANQTWVHTCCLLFLMSLDFSQVMGRGALKRALSSSDDDRSARPTGAPPPDQALLYGFVGGDVNEWFTNK